MSIILASASPRRKELLEMLGVKDLKIVPAVGEEKSEPGLAPEELVKALALHKAREVAESCGAEDIVIAADTIVWHDKRVFGKPHTEAEAARMLRALSGRRHEVYTGVAVLRGGALSLEAERSYVRFRELSDAEIAAYIRTGEPMDKAGAYGAQGKAALFVEGIEGDFFNVMGLPLCRLGRMLNRLGVSLL
jgi:septum formation protein